MYHTRKNPLKRVRRDSEDVDTVRTMKSRRLHKAFLRYHDAANWPMLREALKRMGRADLIGNGKNHLVPNYQPAGTSTRFTPPANIGRARRRPAPARQPARGLRDSGK